MLAQGVQQGCTGIERKIVQLAVDQKLDRHRGGGSLIGFGGKRATRKATQQERGGSGLDDRPARDLHVWKNGLCVVHVCSVVAGQIKDVERSSPGSWPEPVRQVDDDRHGRAAHDDPPERKKLGRIDLHVRKKRGNVNEVAGLRSRRELALVAPANLAPAREDECDGLLLAVVVDSSSCAWLDFEE